MSSGGGKGGNANRNTTTVYYGTIAGVLGEGPACVLEFIIANGKLVVTTPISRSGSDDYVDFTIPGYGNARLYWGTESQSPDPTLSTYAEQPAYRGWVYLVLNDICFGKNGETSPPNLEIGWRRFPNQLIVTGGPAMNDGGFTANPIAVSSELLTSWNWLEYPSTKLYTPSFQAVAEEFEAEFPAGGTRSFAAISPLWNSKTELRAALADIASVSGAWVRLRPDGKIEAGRWKRGGSVGTIRALTVDDLVFGSEPKIKVGRGDKLPNSFVVEFTDADKHFKKNCTTPANSASVRSTGIVRQNTAKRPLLLTFDQANRHGNDLLAENATPPMTIQLEVMRPRAVTPTGERMRPGDYFTFPVQPHPADPADVRLFRCTRRSFNPTGQVTISGEMERNVAVAPAQANPPVSNLVEILPPLYYRRPIPLHRETTDDSQPIYILAARPSDLSTGFNIHYDSNPAGDFPVMGSQNGFQLPLQLNAGFDDNDSTVQVTLLPNAGGRSARRDADMLRDYNGGMIEALADSLVLIAVKLVGGAIALQPDGVTPYYEVMSVTGPAAVIGADTFEIPVLRGRQGTAALDFNGGSFPDGFANYELWLCVRSELIPVYHPDFDEMIVSLNPAYFRYSAYGRTGIYDPATAYAERVRLDAIPADVGEFVLQTNGTDHVPQDTFSFPTELMDPVNMGLLGLFGAQGFVSFVFIRSNTTPSTPTGGSYTSPLPTSSPTWSDAVPAGTDTLWMSKRKFTYTGVGQDSAWSAPGLASSSADVEFQFSTLTSSPGTPTTHPGNWSSTGTTSSIFMATRTRSAGTWSAWSVVKIKGEAGANGNYVDYRFKRASSTPSTPTGDIPSGWYDAPPAADGNPLYMSMAAKDYSGSLISAWSTPVQIDGDGIQVQYSSDASTWHDPPFVDGSDIFMRQRVGASGTWSAAMRIVGERGADGAPGNTYTLYIQTMWNGVGWVIPYVNGSPGSPDGGGISTFAGLTAGVNHSIGVASSDGVYTFTSWGGDTFSVNCIDNPLSNITGITMVANLTIIANN